MSRRIVSAGLVALACGPGVGSAMAAGRKPQVKLPYTSGAYAGTIHQILPSPTTGQIKFVASPGSLSAVNVKVREFCGNLLWVTLADAPKGLRISVSKNGSFSYDRILAGDRLTIKGRIHGRVASGTIFDSLKSGPLGCSMEHAGTFSAQR